MCRTAKYQLTNGQTGRIKTHYLRWKSPGREKGGRTIHLQSHLRRSLGHIGGLIKSELDNTDALYILALDVLNTIDIQELILHAGGKEPFHLLRRHTAIGLDHINGRQVQLRKYINRDSKNGHHREQ